MGQTSRSQGGTLPPPLGIIKVIHVASIRVSASHRRGSKHHPSIGAGCGRSSWKKSRLAKEKIAFDDNDFKGTT